MSKRLIDANELISAMYYYEHNEGGLTAYDAQDIINKAPSIDIPQWIPCSERLPDENVVVLTQAKFKDDIKMAVSARQDYNYWTGWGTREVNIVAWMPLPKPWKGADDDEID